MVAKSYRDLSLIRRASSSPRFFDIALRTQALGDKGPRLFECSPLNRTILVKHTLAKQEREDIVTRQHTVTKIIFPIDLNNLASGGYAVFLEELGTRKKLIRFLQNARGFESFSDDMRKLTLLSRIPMFDPFLMRERFRMAGLAVDDACFSVDPRREERVMGVIHGHIEELFAGVTDDVTLAMRIADGFCYKVFSNEFAEYASRLNQFFGLEDRHMVEALFAWKAFLYQQMQFDEMQRQILDDLRLLFECPLPRSMRHDHLAFAEAARERLHKAVHTHFTHLNNTFAAYDKACVEFSVLSSPGKFIAFLNEAPKHAFDAGEHLAMLMHYAKLIRFRVGMEQGLSDARGALELYQDLDLSILEPIEHEEGLLAS